MFPTPDIICLPIGLKILTLFVCILGAIIGYLISNISIKFYNKSLNYYKIRHFRGSMWNMPVLSTLGVIYYPLLVGKGAYDSIDQG
jgi:NADH-ubiquinone oxidoreductase chain 5